MKTLFKRGQKVKLLIDPDPEYIEYHTELEDSEESLPSIKKGSIGEINIILPNGQYHIEFKDKNGTPIAYFPMSEENLEPVN